METEKKETNLLPEALERFRQKTLFSVHVLPACHGGYDPKDELCQNCSIATADKILVGGIHAIADRINEEDVACLRIRESGAPFFAKYSISCAEEHERLQGAASRLQNANQMREERRAIKDIARLPKGEVRHGRAPFDYVKWYGGEGLWIRLGKHSEKFLSSCGALYRYDGRELHRDQYYFRPDRIVSYIRYIMKSTEANTFSLFKPKEDEEYFLVFPRRQEKAQECLALEVVRKNKEGEEGEEVFIIGLEPDSFQTVSARFDDIGQL